MTQKVNPTSPKTKRETATIVFYVSAAIVAVLAVAYLIFNIVMFRKIIEQYVAQGYPKAEVVKQLVQAQLFPEIIQPTAVMGGIAVLLCAAGIINKKVSKCLALLAKDEIIETAEESIPEDNTADIGAVAVEEALEVSESNDSENDQAPGIDS